MVAETIEVSNSVKLLGLYIDIEYNIYYYIRKICKKGNQEPHDQARI